MPPHLRAFPGALPFLRVICMLQKSRGLASLRGKPEGPPSIKAAVTSSLGISSPCKGSASLRAVEEQDYFPNIANPGSSPMT